MPRLAAAAGARRGELCALRWSDVELETGLVWIRRSLVVGQDLELVEKATKTHAERRFTFDAGTVDELRAHRRRMNERSRICEATLAADGFVFSHDADCGRPWRPDYVTANFTRLRRLGDVPGVRFHDYADLRVMPTSVRSRCSPRRGSAGPPTQQHPALAFLAAVSSFVMSRLDRITADPEIAHGQPAIRGLRYSVENLPDLLASGMTIKEIIKDHPDLEREDLPAALELGGAYLGPVPRRPPRH